LKRGLLAAGHSFVSETDTEVISHLIEEGLEQGHSFEDAFLRMGRLVKGSQAITATSQEDPGKLCAMRLGYAGGVVVAHRDGQGIVGSDLPAVLPLLRQESPSGKVGFLEPGEMASVTVEGVSYRDIDGNYIDKQLRSVSPEDVIIDKGGHRHFMLKEIMEQPQAMLSVLRNRVDFQEGRIELSELPYSQEEIHGLQRVVLIGCGTSFHAAQVGRHLMEQLGGLPAEAESASEFRYRDPLIDDRTLVITITQSGETADTVAAMQLVREKGGKLVTICNVEGSQTTRLADATLYTGSGMEIGVASTKTFIAALTALFVLATYLGQTRGFLSPARTRELVDQLAQCPRMMGEMLADTSVYQRLARRFSGYNNFLYLGRGINAPIALEGALKLKEISYIHAEGYPAGEMKHGPIALIDQGMATLALAPRDSLYDKMVNNILEVKARDGVVIALVTEGDQELVSQVDEVLYMPKASDLLTPLLATLPLQLLAYHIAVLRGCDVDQPRNLAKSVTVE
jgi:glucosamine--fructose-6-phosphate aminotransferase (isomerizing)